MPLQAVVAISAAAQSLLPDGLQKQLNQAHLAVTTALQALTLLAGNASTSPSSRASSIEVLVNMVADLMQHALAKHTWPVASLSEELYVEQVAVLAACCRAVASMGSSQQVSGLRRLPGEELTVSLLEHRESSQHMIQVSQVSYIRLARPEMLGFCELSLLHPVNAADASYLCPASPCSALPCSACPALHCWFAP